MPDFPLTDSSRVDLEMVQGIWSTAAVEVDGSPLAPWLFESARLVITGDRFILRPSNRECDSLCLLFEANQNRRLCL